MLPNPAQLIVRLLFLVYGFASLQSASLIGISDSWRFLQGTQLSPTETGQWHQLSFNDTDWPQAVGGFVDGLADGNRRLSQATRIGNFGLGYHTLLLRRAFDVEDPESVRSLIMRLQFVHGIVLWLNGERVFQSGFQDDPADGVVALDAFAQLRMDNVIEEISMDHMIPLLRKGHNVLAVQVHASDESLTFSFAMELMADFVRDPMVHHLTSETALLSWKTAQPVTSVVRYGLTRELHHSLKRELPLIEPEVRLSSLLPGARYFYRVELDDASGKAVSHVASFRTPSPNDTTLQFAVLGDSGRGTVPQYDIAGEIRRTNLDLVMHTGDTVYPFLFPELVDFRFYSIYGPHMATTPYYLATGNHDRDLGVEMVADLYHLPVNQTDPSVHLSHLTTDESYYTVVHGPAQFFVLYAPFLYQYDFSMGFAQHAWLEEALRQSDRPWKFIVMHHPMRTSSLHWADNYNGNQVLDTLEVRNVVLPLAQQYGVQAVFSGHDHVYERFQPEGGVVSVTTAGGGGSLYTLGRRDSLSSQFRRAFHFVRASIDGNECRVEAVGATGEVLDTFYLSLQADDPADYRSTWHTPVVEHATANDLDGNIWGQQFDFDGDSVLASPGKFSHAGKLSVNHDEQFLYIGFEGVVLPDDGALFVLIGSVGDDPPTAPSHPWLDGLQFEGWSPDVMGVLGDEYGDGHDKAFHRSGSEGETWQGLFSLGRGFFPLEEAHIQQYNMNPQVTTMDLVNTHLAEQNANYIELAIPWASLPESLQDDGFKLAVISGKQPVVASDASLVWDTSAIGGVVLTDADRISVKGIRVDVSDGPDADGDGLSDAQEILQGTKVHQADTDSDGLPDGWEVHHGFSPLVSEGVDGALGDPDGDGYSNLNEWLTCTDPNQAESNLSLDIKVLEPGIIRLRWIAMPGVLYGIEKADSMEQGFAPLQSEDTDFKVGKNPRTIDFYVPVLRGQQQFYRVIANRLQGNEAF